MASIIAVVVGFIVAIIAITAVAIPVVKGINTTGWTASEVALVGTVSLMLVLGLFVMASRFTGFGG